MTLHNHIGILSENQLESEIMFEIVNAFLDHALSEYGIDFQGEIEVDGVQARYKTPEDKGNQKSGFVTFYLDDNPMAVFGHWKKYGPTAYKWFYRNQSELSPQEKADNARKAAERKKSNEIRIANLRHGAAVKAGGLWGMNCLGNISYGYATKKQIVPFGARFFDNQVAFEYFATDERKALRDSGEIQVYSSPVMVLPVVNRNNQLVSLQQISQNGKFKGFLPDGEKKGCFMKIQGCDTIIFEVEGYATGCTIHELTGCTVYVAFDSGNLLDVAGIIDHNHPDAIKIVASDDDRFTPPPHNNVGQIKAKAVVEKLGFFNLKPNFYDDQEGSDWNDLLLHYPKQVIKDHLMTRVKRIVDYVDGD